MLNAESKLVFDILRQLTGDDGNYKVIEADEILEKLPEGTTMSKVQLSGIIRDLKDRDYLKVKYFTPEEYCLLTIRRIEEIQQIVEEVTAVAVNENPDGLSSLAVAGGKKTAPVKHGLIFLYSFLGSLLGGGIVAAIAVLLQKFLF